MWDWLKKSAEKFVRQGQRILNYQAIVEGFFAMAPVYVLSDLEVRIPQMQQEDYEAFIGCIHAMSFQEQENVRRIQSGEASGFGNSFEGQLWRAMAGSDPRESLAMQNAVQRLKGFQWLLIQSERIRREGTRVIRNPSGTQGSKRPPNLEEAILDDSDETDFGTLYEMLEEMFVNQTKAGTITAERKILLQSKMREIKEMLGSPAEPDISNNMIQAEKIRQIAREIADIGRSSGVKIAPAGSRSGRLQDLFQGLKSNLKKDLNRSQIGYQESERGKSLLLRYIEAENAISQLKSTQNTQSLEREVLRPLARDTRAYTLRYHLTLAEPTWASPPVSEDPSGIYVSGSSTVKRLVGQACSHLGLNLLELKNQRNPAQVIWDALRSCHLAVFDFTAYQPKLGEKSLSEASEVAATAYELGIALALGKAVVIVCQEGGPKPFDVDISPVCLSQKQDAVDPLIKSLDESLYGMQRGRTDSSMKETLEYLRERFGTHPNKNVEITLRILEEEGLSDPIKFNYILRQVLGILGEKAPQILYPAWPGRYPSQLKGHCFHVMPFGAPWSDAVMQTVESICEASHITYVRGDRVLESNIISSIWNDICRATHVLVDLTGFNANVSLELGIAHTLGRNTCIIGQPGTEKALFPSLAEIRLLPYETKTGSRSLEEVVKKFLRDSLF